MLAKAAFHIHKNCGFPFPAHIRKHNRLTVGYNCVLDSTWTRFSFRFTSTFSLPLSLCLLLFLFFLFFVVRELFWKLKYVCTLDRKQQRKLSARAQVNWEWEWQSESASVCGLCATCMAVQQQQESHMRRCGPNKVNGHSTKTFCQNIKAAATVRKVDQWIWPSRAEKNSQQLPICRYCNNNNGLQMQLVVEGEEEREVEAVVLFVLGYRKRISVWFSSQLNRAWQQQQQQQ